VRRTALRLATACALLAAALSPAAAPAIGRFDINPVAITFAPGETSASVQITNDGTAAQELEIGVKSWTRSDGRDEGDPTDDIIASPSIFIVAPGQTQLVRLGPARDLSGDVERTYRLVATEVPAAGGPATMQTILRLRLPVFIAPHTVVSTPLVWQVTRDDASRLIVSTRNDGNVHRRIRSVRITSGGRVVFDNVVAAYVLAHQTRQWLVPLEAGLRVEPLEVRATLMDGAIQVASFRLQ
jgi:fimbrial chaperone protein